MEKGLRVRFIHQLQITKGAASPLLQNWYIGCVYKAPRSSNVPPCSAPYWSRSTLYVFFRVRLCFSGESHHFIDRELVSGISRVDCPPILSGPLDERLALLPGSAYSQRFSEADLSRKYLKNFSDGNQYISPSIIPPLHIGR